MGVGGVKSGLIVNFFVFMKATFAYVKPQGEVRGHLPSDFEVCGGEPF